MVKALLLLYGNWLYCFLGFGEKNGMGVWASGVEGMGDTPQSQTTRAPAVLKTSQSTIILSITTLKVQASEMHQLLRLPAASNVINAAALNTFAAAVSTSSTIAGGDAALSLIFHFKCSCKSVTHKVGSDMASDSCLHIYFIDRVQMKHCK